jgi:hypothetical protein
MITVMDVMMMMNDGEVDCDDDSGDVGHHNISNLPFH